MEAEMIQAREAVLQSVLMINDNLVSHQALYLTILFAYIAVGYVAGAKLTRTQLGLMTFLFVLASFYEILNITLLSWSNTIKLYQLAEFGGQIPESPLGNQLGSVLLTASLWTSGAVAALAFMWTVRHPKAE